MYLYRTMSSNELINRINGIDTNEQIVQGENTFKYKENVDYIHFFKFADHAKQVMDRHKELVVLARYKVPDNLIPPMEFGFYSQVKTYYDDYFFNKYIPLPEYIIERKLIKREFIDEFQNDLYGDFAPEYDSKNVFWVDKKEKTGIMKYEEKLQLWDKSSIYYEYIKYLMPKFEYNTYKIANYLKTIDLDKKLNEVTNKIKNKNMVIKRHNEEIEEFDK